jgi:hypothetical protein
VRTVGYDWIGKLLTPVTATTDPILVTPVYTRNRFEGNTTNHIVTPYLFACFGQYIQQPIAGEFAMNSAFVEHALTWPLVESTMLYGIDVFLTGNALAQGIPVVEVALSRKLHNPGFPKILFMSQQVIDSLFRILTASPPTRRGHARTTQSSQRRSVDDHAEKPQGPIVDATIARVHEYLRVERADILKLFSGSFEPWDDGRVALPPVDARAWVDILATGLRAVTPESFYRVRDHLVSLYLCRVMTYWEEIATLSVDAIEDLLVWEANELRASLGDWAPSGRISEAAPAMRGLHWNEAAAQSSKGSPSA